MKFEKDGQLYVDTAFLNAIQAPLKSRACELKHPGFGEFFLQTPVGAVRFVRMDGRMEPWDGCSGRPHQVKGDQAAIALMLAHADGC